MRELQITARHALGVFLLGVVVTLWVASSFLMRSIFGEGKSYDKPFLVWTMRPCIDWSLMHCDRSLGSILARSPSISYHGLSAQCYQGQMAGAAKQNRPGHNMEQKWEMRSGPQVLNTITISS